MLPWIPTWKYLGFAVYLVLYFVTCQSVWDHPPETIRSAIFKALPLLHLVVVIYSADRQEAGYAGYRKNVVLGLVFSLAGDVMLVWRTQLFLYGLIAFAVAHAFYIRAFGLRPFGGGPCLTSCVILAVASYAVVIPRVTDDVVMTLSVTIYQALIFLVTWRAVVAYMTWPARGTFCACVGSGAFALSDFLLAYDRWCRPIEGAAFYVHALYFGAQLLITTSVMCYEARHLEKQD